MKRVLIPCVLLALGTLACQDTTAPSPLASDAPELTTVTAASPSGMKGVVEMISGSGHYVTPAIGLQPDKWRVFTMHAQKTADGNVTGSFNRIVHSQGMEPERASGTITCFTVDGTTAWIGGYLDGPDHFEVAWQVVDNGEGKWADPDQVGLQFHTESFPILGEGFIQDFCEQTPEGLDFGPPYNYVPLFALLSDVEGGNIQIKVK